jgi:molybdopterin-guanine dinucleotide biosynthesis protein A
MTHDFDGVVIVAGSSMEGRPHQWIEIDGKLVIDITADQFGTGIQSVIVTFDREWHDTFQNRKLKSGDFMTHPNGKPFGDKLRRMYEIILRNHI